MSNSPGEKEKRERLEPPSDELKMIRKQLLVEKLMKSPDATIPENRDNMENNQSAPGSGSSRKTFKLDVGPSSVLSRLKSFLPQMKSANDRLSNLDDLSSVSVEADITDEQVGLGQPLIEMNLQFVSPIDESDDSDFDKSMTSESEEEDDTDKNLKIGTTVKIGAGVDEASPSLKAKGKDLISEFKK